MDHRNKRKTFLKIHKNILLNLWEAKISQDRKKTLTIMEKLANFIIKCFASVYLSIHPYNQTKTLQKKMFSLHIPDKGYLVKTHKILLQVNNK